MFVSNCFWCSCSSMLWLAAKVMHIYDAIRVCQAVELFGFWECNVEISFLSLSGTQCLTYKLLWVISLFYDLLVSAITLLYEYCFPYLHIPLRNSIGLLHYLLQTDCCVVFYLHCLLVTAAGFCSKPFLNTITNGFGGNCSIVHACHSFFQVQTSTFYRNLWH